MMERSLLIAVLPWTCPLDRVSLSPISLGRYRPQNPTRGVKGTKNTSVYILKVVTA